MVWVAESFWYLYGFRAQGAEMRRPKMKNLLADPS